MLSGFSWKSVYVLIHSAEASWYFQALASPTDLPIEDLPTPLYDLFRQVAGLSLLRLHIAHIGSTGILTGWPSTTPLGFALGPDLPAAD